MLKYIYILLLSMLFPSIFIPDNNQDINYTHVFFKWPQIENANGYQIEIFIEGEDNPVFSRSSESNSYLLDELLNW